MPGELWNFDEAERLLFEAEFESTRPVWASSNYVFFAELCVGDLQISTVYKPLNGETPLWDFPPGLYRREVAAYRFSRLLGWPMVPPTIAREGPAGMGSVQLVIEHDPAQNYFVLREQERYLPQLKRIAAFDIAANNADRKGGHCLLDGTGQIWGIDHGLCFHPAYKLRSVMWDWVDEPLDEGLLADLERAAGEIARRNHEAEPLAALLTDEELTATVRRIEGMVKQRRFPAPGPARHWPWPLV